MRRFPRLDLRSISSGDARDLKAIAVRIPDAKNGPMSRPSKRTPAAGGGVLAKVSESRPAAAPEARTRRTQVTVRPKIISASRSFERLALGRTCASY